MIIVYGTRMYGRIKACGSSFIATRFVHIWYVPLVPIGSVLVFEGDRGVDAPFNFKSMLAGYLRVWGPIGVILAIISTVGIVEDFADEPLAMIVGGAFSLFVVLLLLVGTILAWAVMGKLSDEEKRKRAVYAQHTGYFVDPADLGPARQSFRERLMATIHERARGLAATGYRMTADPTQAWPHIALDPTQNDEVLITAACTLARLDASLAQGPWATQLETLHGQLWQRLVHMNASCLRQPVPTY